MKIRILHNEEACESTLEPADRVIARVVNAEGTFTWPWCGRRVKVLHWELLGG